MTGNGRSASRQVCEPTAPSGMGRSTAGNPFVVRSTNVGVGVETCSDSRTGHDYPSGKKRGRKDRFAPGSASRSGPAVR